MRNLRRVGKVLPVTPIALEASKTKTSCLGKGHVGLLSLPLKVLLLKSQWCSGSDDRAMIVQFSDNSNPHGLSLTPAVHEWSTERPNGTFFE